MKATASTARAQVRDEIGRTGIDEAWECDWSSGSASIWRQQHDSAPLVRVSRHPSKYIRSLQHTSYEMDDIYLSLTQKLTHSAPRFFGRSKRIRV